MPVIQLSLARLGRYCKNKASEKTILETLPYLGLDIEDQSGDDVSVEYSPNRPDFSSEAGIARSLVGLLGIEVGLPVYEFGKSKFKIQVTGREIAKVRPIIDALYAEIDVTDDLIKQLIAMQEDLHNGLGRKRTKVAIGIHNAAVISESITYYGVTDKRFSFVPLGSAKKQTIAEILSGTEQGQSYGKILSHVFPMLEDSNGNVLSMPPVINGNLTRLETGVSKLFVDVTGTDDYAVETSAAIIASMLTDVGAKVFQVELTGDGETMWVPDMTERKMVFDLKLSNEILGFDLNTGHAREALEKSRLALGSDGVAVIPKYRSDILHPIDLAEEVALGYGIWKISPQVVSSALVGSLNAKMNGIDSAVEILVGLGMTEIWNLSLVSRGIAENGGKDSLKMEDSKSQSFEFLRSDIASSLLQVLSGTTHQEYPQKIFEVAPVFSSSKETVSGVLEVEHVSAMIADSKNARYSEIRSAADAFFRLFAPENSKVRYRPASDNNTIFAIGRSAEISITLNGKESNVGIIGEISPQTLERFGIPVPVAGFELNLEPLLLKA